MILKVILRDFSSIFLTLLLVRQAAFFGSVEIDKFPSRSFRDGDIIIGAIVPITKETETGDTNNQTEASCNVPIPESVLWVEALIFAIGLANKDQNLLGHLTLGYDIRDSCDNSIIAVKHALDFIHAIEGARLSRVIPVSSATSSRKMGDNGVEKHSLIGLQTTPLSAPKNTDKFIDFVSNTSENGGTLENPQEDMTDCSEKPVAAVISCMNSQLTSNVAGLLQIAMLPLVGFRSTTVSLSDKNRFPSFVRTISPDSVQARVMVDIMTSFGWSYVSVIGADNEYGRQGLERLLKETSRQNICVAVREIFNPESPSSDLQINEIIGLLAENRKARLVVLFMGWAHADRILEEAQKQNLTGMVWMASEAWGRHPETKAYSRSLVEGTIGVSLPRQIHEQFEKHFEKLDVICAIENPWLLSMFCQKGICDPEVVEYHRECCQRRQRYSLSRKYCPLPVSLMVPRILQDTIDYVETETLFDAVFSIVYGIQSYLTNNYTDNERDIQARLQNFDHAEFLNHLKSVDFQNFNGRRVGFNSKGDIMDNRYDIVNLQFDECHGGLVWKTIGDWSMVEEKISLNLDKRKVKFHEGARKVVSRCSVLCDPGYEVLQTPQECCWDCQPCPHGTVSNITMATKCSPCGSLEHTEENRTKCIPDHLQWLFLSEAVGIVILVSSVIGQVITLTVISILGRHKNNPICSALAFKTTSLLVCYGGFLQPIMYTVEPSATLCTFRKITWFSVYIMHGAILVARTYKVKSLADKLKKQFGFKVHNIHHVIMWLFAVVGFVLLAMSFLDSVPDVVYRKYTPSSAFLACEEDNKAADYILIAYPFILLTITGLVAETDKHSHSLDDKFLGYTSGAMLLMLAIFLPIFYSIEIGIGRVIILAISVAITQYAVLFLTYFTKIYYMFRNYHKKETVRTALAIERQNLADFSENNQDNGTVTSSNNDSAK